MKKKTNKFQDIDKKPNLSLNGFNVLDPKKMLFWRFSVGAGIISFFLQMIIFAVPPLDIDSISYQLAYSVSFFIPIYGTSLFLGIVGIICLYFSLRGTRQDTFHEKLIRKYIPILLYFPLLIQTGILILELIL